MATSTIALLLNLAASLLLRTQQAPALSPSSTAAIVGIANRSVQLAAQAEAPIDFVVPKNTDMWPTVGDLMQSAYRNADGAYVHEGPSATLVQSTVSFGDLNGDGFDDAAGIVELPGPGSVPAPYLAMFLNQNGVMFNIADLPLGASTTVYSHHIMNGVLTMDMQIAGHPRATSTYALWGNRIVQE
jgi:hypothetical protein